MDFFQARQIIFFVTACAACTPERGTTAATVRGGSGFAPRGGGRVKHKKHIFDCKGVDEGGGRVEPKP